MSTQRRSRDARRTVEVPVPSSVEDVSDDPVLASDLDDVAALRRRVESLEAIISALAERFHAVGAPSDAVNENAVRRVDAGVGSRRHLLQLAGAAIVAGGVVASAETTRVSAATDDVMQVGVRHFATNITRIEYGTAPKAAALPLTTEERMLWVDNSTSPTSAGIGVRGDGSPDFGIGLDGVGGTGVRGTGSMIPGVGQGVTGNGYYGVTGGGAVGVFASGSIAALQLTTLNSVSPPMRAGGRGQLDVDESGALWYCVATGSPGPWRKLSGVGTAGSFHAIDPVRSFDTRWLANTRVTDGTSVLVSVADAHDPAGGVTAASVVPTGATAISYNLTVTRTAGAGFLSVTPGSPTAPSGPPTTSSINWTADGATLANGLAVKLDESRQIRVRCGAGSTDFIIDVTGYYL